MTNEDFILVKGYDYQPAYMQELLYLALGGAPFSPQDFAIAYQSY